MQPCRQMKNQGSCRLEHSRIAKKLERIMPLGPKLPVAQVVSGRRLINLHAGDAYRGASGVFGALPPGLWARQVAVYCMADSSRTAMTSANSTASVILIQL